MNKSTFVGFRASPEEREKIALLASACGVTQSEMLRLLVSVADTQYVARLEPVVPSGSIAALVAAKGDPRATPTD